MKILISEDVIALINFILVDTGEVPIPITLEMPDIPSGMYICTIRDKQGKTTTMKVVKQ